jgi:hypothetical protein
MYLLSDNDLKSLGSIEKTNPQHKSWTTMRMYLASQVWDAIGVGGWLSVPIVSRSERALETGDL